MPIKGLKVKLRKAQQSKRDSLQCGPLCRRPRYQFHSIRSSVCILSKKLRSPTLQPPWRSLHCLYIYFLVIFLLFLSVCPFFSAVLTHVHVRNAYSYNKSAVKQTHAVLTRISRWLICAKFLHGRLSRPIRTAHITYAALWTGEVTTTSMFICLFYYLKNRNTQLSDSKCRCVTNTAQRTCNSYHGQFCAIFRRWGGYLIGLYLSIRKLGMNAGISLSSDRVSKIGGCVPGPFLEPPLASTAVKITVKTFKPLVVEVVR